MGMKYKDPTTGNFKEINVKVADTLPVGSEVDYNGTTIPTGWEEVDSPNDYSTEETRIGTWMGKPLYRKTFSNITIPDATGSSSVILLSFTSIDNFDKIWLDESASFMIKDTEIPESLGFNFYGGGNNWSRIFIRKREKTVRMISGVSLVDYTGNITLLYTKSTD